MTRLTHDEQYTLMNLFCIFRSPLMFGGDLPSNDEFTLSLLTNKEVLRMHREGTDVRQLFQQDGKAAITSGNEKPVKCTWHCSTSTMKVYPLSTYLLKTWVSKIAA